MTTEELKLACMNKSRVVVRIPGKTTWRGHHIEAIVHKPDHNTGKWIPYANIAFGEEEPYTIYSGNNAVPAVYVFVDSNPHSDGFTMFRKYKEQLKSEVEAAEQLRLQEGVYND